MTRRLAPVIVVTAGIAGCGGSSTPTSPTPGSSASLAGSWSGSINDPVSGNGTAQLSLSPAAQNSFGGTWSATFPNGATVSGPAIAAPATPTTYGITLYADPHPPCSTTSGPGVSALLAYILINVGVTSTRLTATVTRLTCSGPGGFGSLNLSRQ